MNQLKIIVNGKNLEPFTGPNKTLVKTLLFPIQNPKISISFHGMELKLLPQIPLDEWRQLVKLSTCLQNSHTFYTPKPVFAGARKQPKGKSRIYFLCRGDSLEKGWCWHQINNFRISGVTFFCYKILACKLWLPFKNDSSRRMRRRIPTPLCRFQKQISRIGTNKVSSVAQGFIFW